uniref:Uncharacterized protein n=1 Tax=Magallana gigas TaxID=29159 RepID=A0A8W8JIX8_MAGGI
MGLWIRAASKSLLREPEQTCRTITAKPLQTGPSSSVVSVAPARTRRESPQSPCGVGRQRVRSVFASEGGNAPGAGPETALSLCSRSVQTEANFPRVRIRSIHNKSPQSGQGKLSLAILKIRGKGYLMRSFGPAYVKAGRGEVEGKEYVMTPEGEDDLKKMQLMELAILNGTYRDSKAIPLARKSQACLRERQGNPDGEDDLKKRQLMELAIINGTYRDTSKPPTTQAGGGQSSTSTHAFGLPWNAQLQTMQMLGQFDTSGLDHKSILKTSEAPRFLTAASPLTAGISQLRSPTPAGAPLILAPRMPQVATSSATMINPPPLVSPTDSAATGLIRQPVQCLRYEGPWTLYGHTLTQGWLFHKFGGSCAYETNSNPPEHLKNKSELQNTGSGASIKGSNARHLTLSPTMFYSQ